MSNDADIYSLGILATQKVRWKGAGGEQSAGKSTFFYGAAGSQNLGTGFLAHS